MVNVLTNLPLSQQWEAGARRGTRLGRGSSASTSRPSIGPVRSSIASWPTPTRTRRWCSASAIRRRGRRACAPRSGTPIYGHSAAAHISKARELVDPNWQALHTAHGAGCGRLRASSAAPRSPPRPTRRRDYPIPGASPAQHPRGPAARVERRRGIGAAVPFLRGGHPAAPPVPALNGERRKMS